MPHTESTPDRSKKKRPRDTNQLAASTMEATTGKSASPHDADDGKNPNAVALGRLGGKKGGPAQAKKLTAEQRREIARKAAKARWGSTR